jgi:hypothetical protein
MILLSLLVGVVVGGFVWFGWDLAIKLRELFEKMRLAARQKKDAAALLDQAKDRKAQER